MNGSRLTNTFSVIFVVAGIGCGPSESLPPNNDAGTTNDAGTSCNGQCVPGLPEDWRGPALLWTGAEAAAPHCSEVAGAPLEVYTGYADPNGPPCGACKCDPPIGSCALPATVTAAAASCAGDGSGVAHTSFDPPASWGGTCTAANAIPAGKLCGGVPCVQSVTIAPLTLTQGGCLPIEPPQVPPPTWKTFARACSKASFPTGCGTEGGACAAAPPSPELKTCIHHKGEPAEYPCPSTYPIQSVFYAGPAPICSPCACGAPEGSTCTGSIGLFSDAACGAPLGAPASLNAKDPTCVDVPPGSALGSKTASEPSYYASSCEPSGGAPLGTVFCCRP
jgi:hypothetical protein